MSDSFQRLKGFADLYGEQARRHALLEKYAREEFSRYGFTELRTPILEQTSLFQRSIGAETDVVQKEMFTFQDVHGRSMSMRPEATAGVMRACAENGLAREGVIARYFTIGPMFRHERPQKGRMRQFHQINCECVGSDSPIVDAELICMLMAFLENLELPELVLKLNSLGCPNCRKEYLQALRAWLANLDATELCEDCRRRKNSNPLRVLDCKQEQCRKTLKDVPLLADWLCDSCKSHFDTVLKLLRAAGIEFELDNRLVRGLDYYIRTTFEVTSSHIGAQTAVAGGGRYDGLLANVGGPDLPGIGFACGMERLELLMPPALETPLDFFIITLRAEEREKAFLIAQNLRNAGFSGEMNYQDGSFKSLMRQANRSGARVCIALGPDEAARAELTLKDMKSGEQQTVTEDKLAEDLVAMLDKIDEPPF